MIQFCEAVGRLLASDPGCRIFPARAPLPDLRALASSLMNGGTMLVVTGFPVVPENIGETDGPGGAVNIARALRAFGKTVYIVTDAMSHGMVSAARDIYAPETEVFCVPNDCPGQYCAGLLCRLRPTHVIAIERPGKVMGHFRNMRGTIIDDVVADTDSLIGGFNGVSVAVGDGGNELGMGSLRHIIAQIASNGEAAAADLGCDFPLVAGVSNWWGWGIAALLSACAGQSLLPTDAQEHDMLAAVTAAGGLDGVTHQPTMSVDGLSLEENLEILRGLRRLTDEFLRGQAVHTTKTEG